MKFYQILTLVSGCLLAASCKDTNSSNTTEQELRDLGLAPAPAQASHTTDSGNSNNASNQVARKSWPPASNDRVSDQMVENFLVVLDDSGSMSGNKMKQAKQALQKLADTLEDKHQLGLMLLNNKDIIKIGPNNRQQFKKAVSRAKANGGTPLTKATKRAFKQITEQASRQQGYGAYHIIIVTDGESGEALQ